MKIPGTCTEYNCIEPVMATGLCSRHYLRNWRERQRMKKDAEMSNICAYVDCHNLIYRLKGRRMHRYCSPTCQKREARRLEKLRTPARTCEIEGCEKRHAAKGLCKSHWKARNREINGREPSTWNDTGRDAYHRRRARQRDTKTGSPVRREAIGFRDGWICQICLESVDPALAYPDPRSPSLEHVVPLSRGGAHDPSNVVIAHLRCNLSKGARTLPVGNLTP